MILGLPAASEGEALEYAKRCQQGVGQALTAITLVE